MFSSSRAGVRNRAEQIKLDRKIFGMIEQSIAICVAREAEKIDVAMIELVVESGVAEQAHVRDGDETHRQRLGHVRAGVMRAVERLS